jgi:hypothetical protein
MSTGRRVDDGTKVITPGDRFDRIDRRMDMLTIGMAALLILHAQAAVPLIQAAGALGIIGAGGSAVALFIRSIL